MKNGTAISANTSMPLNRYFGSAISGSDAVPQDRRERAAAQRERNRHADREQHDARNEEDDAHSFTDSGSNSSSTMNSRFVTYGRAINSRWTISNAKPIGIARYTMPTGICITGVVWPHVSIVYRDPIHTMNMKNPSISTKTSARIFGACSRRHVLQRVDADMAAVAQHQPGAEEREPDHQVARHFLDPQDRLVGQEAQRDVGEHHQRHRREHHNQQPAVDPQQPGIERLHVTTSLVFLPSGQRCQYA